MPSNIQPSLCPQLMRFIDNGQRPWVRKHRILLLAGALSQRKAIVDVVLPRVVLRHDLKHILSLSPQSLQPN